MRVWALFPALQLSLSDTARHPPVWARIEGLRHELRHKILCRCEMSGPPIVQGIPTPPPPPARARSRSEKILEKFASRLPESMKGPRWVTRSLADLGDAARRLQVLGSRMN